MFRRASSTASSVGSPYRSTLEAAIRRGSYDLVEETKRRYGVRAKDDLPWEGMKEIAEATKAILRKLDVHSRVEAAVMAVERNFCNKE